MRPRVIERRRWRNKGREFFALHLAVTIRIDLTNQCVARLLVETLESVKPVYPAILPAVRDAARHFT